MNAIAIIAARGGSKRLPRKNIKNLGGAPMITYPIRAAMKSNIFDQIIVSTEDDEIADISRAEGVHISVRPMELATDSARVTHVCKQVLAELELVVQLPEFICSIYPTAAFISSTDLVESHSYFKDRPDVNYVMAVAEYPIHPFKALEEQNGFLQPVWPDKNKGKSNFFPKQVASCGTFYWARTKEFLKSEEFSGEGLIGYELPFERALDIDNEADFMLAEKLAKVNISG